MKTKAFLRVTVPFKYFIKWLSVLLVRSRIDAMGAIQDSDPYLEGLLAKPHKIR